MVVAAAKVEAVVLEVKKAVAVTAIKATEVQAMVMACVVAEAMVKTTEGAYVVAVGAAKVAKMVMTMMVAAVAAATMGKKAAGKNQEETQAVGVKGGQAA